MSKSSIFWILVPKGLSEYWRVVWLFVIIIYDYLLFKLILATLLLNLVAFKKTKQNILFKQKQII